MLPEMHWQSTLLQILAGRYLPLSAHVHSSTPTNDAPALTANTPHVAFFCVPSSYFHPRPSRRRSSRHVNDSTSALIVVSPACCSRHTLLHPTFVRDLFCVSVSPITNALLFAFADAFHGSIWLLVQFGSSRLMPLNFTKPFGSGLLPRPHRAYRILPLSRCATRH